MDFLKRKPKDLDGAEAEGQDAVDETGSIIDNDKAQKRQRMIFFGIGGVAVIAATMFVLDTGETVDEAVTAGTETEVSTDALMNRQRVDQEWMAMYEGQVNSQDQRLKGVEAQAGQVSELQNEIQALRGENAAMARDGQQVLEAYERENQQLRQQVGRGNARPTAPGPVAAARDLGVPPAPGTGAAATLPPVRRGNDVQMVSFAQGTGTGSRIDPSKAPAVYTDSPNYLPPNSIANAIVVVGVDATTNTRSQSDPLPVLLRITGPARSVYGDGKLLATRVQGCMVNGAAYGDLSSEKVYVKLQRMTCAQPGGRFAVSEVKGFIAFGGKVGVRGRVVSREGSLTTQAFLAGLVSGAGNAFQGANQIPRIAQGSPNLPSASDVGIQAIGGGAANAGSTLSDYLIERAEQYQPVVEMPTGAAVEVVFLDGTFIRN
ncbi:MAG: conjugal transfer protein TraB [Hyphomonas sp.]|jgi:conjugal transfer pilus assembly protein TraB|uniref:TrbI/VirB10 family protein n=1 Tax=Hyphomonas sp. TaxID=87 RepID=UPI001DE3842E|nr:TrbI/VirB10 family protein [Hyphomonas sp.]MBA4228719.1 conjugal transfer protein TraB [Hyphomonas sp.]